jgi:hypothetical protein
MYFYTDLKSRGGHGLAGVNLNNGRTEREVKLSNLDERFLTDEALGVLYSAEGNRMFAYPVADALPNELSRVGCHDQRLDLQEFGSGCK